MFFIIYLTVNLKSDTIKEEDDGIKSVAVDVGDDIESWKEVCSNLFNQMYF